MLAPMFDGLDSIDWTSLAHAYGSAHDVPHMIRAMASDDPEARQQAFYEAYSNICHQGTVYSATAPAVPFLIEVAAAADRPDRDRVLELLFQVAHGHSYPAHRHPGGAGEHVEQPASFDDAMSDELRWVQAATQAVAAGRPVYLDLLYDDTPEVRRHAARMLTCCPDHRADIVPALKRAFEADEDSGTRATTLYAVAVLAVADESGFVRAALDDRDPLVRLAAALCSAFFMEEAPSPDVINTLTYFLDRSDDVAYDGLVFGEDCVSDIGSALARVEGSQRAEVAQRLVDVAERGLAAPQSVAEPMLQLAFDGPCDAVAPENLTPLQRRVVDFVSTHAWAKQDDGGWTVYSNFTGLLADFGLEHLGRESSGYDQ